MKKNKLYLITIILSIWNLILFYGNSFGISFILFNIPTALLIIAILQKQNKINNKYGLLFVIPIIVLSISFLRYTSLVTTIFNFIAIIIFYLLMIMFTVNKTYVITNIIENILNIIFAPLDKLNIMLKDLTSNINKKDKKDKKNKKTISKETQNTIISIIFAIPIIIIILVLLSSADMMFGKIFDNFFINIDLVLDKLTNIEISEVVYQVAFRIIYLIVFFIYFTSSMFFLKHFYNKKEYPEVERKNSELTIKPLLFILNIIYILFDFIQIRSLIFHKVSMDITYAEYARQGFFQLMFVSFINIVIILVAKKFNPSDKKANRILSILMILLTAVIVVSSFMRMNMYEAAYGYTVLRLLVYVILITELILMIPTMIYIIKDNFNVIKYYIIICTTIYTIIGVLPLDNIIANRNIEKYNKDHKIDIQYLMNNEYDNIPVLLDFYKGVNNNQIKVELNEYFLDTFQNNLEYHNKKIDFFSEYNISRYRALKEIKKYDFNKDRKELLIDSSYITVETFHEDNIEYEIYTYDAGNEIYRNKEGYTRYDENYNVETSVRALGNIYKSNKLKSSDLTTLDYYNLLYHEHYEEDGTYSDTFELYYYDEETNTLHHITKGE